MSQFCFQILIFVRQKNQMKFNHVNALKCVWLQSHQWGRLRLNITAPDRKKYWTYFFGTVEFAKFFFVQRKLFIKFFHQLFAGFFVIDENFWFELWFRYWWGTWSVFGLYRTFLFDFLTSLISGSDENELIIHTMGLGFSSSNLWSSLFTSILLPDWSVSSSLSEMHIHLYCIHRDFSKTMFFLPTLFQPVCVSSVVNIPDANTSLLTWTLFPKCSGSVNGRLSSVTDSSKCLWPKNTIILYLTPWMVLPFIQRDPRLRVFSSPSSKTTVYVEQSFNLIITPILLWKYTLPPLVIFPTQFLCEVSITFPSKWFSE